MERDAKWRPFPVDELTSSKAGLIGLWSAGGVGAWPGQSQVYDKGLIGEPR